MMTPEAMCLAIHSAFEEVTSTSGHVLMSSTKGKNGKTGEKAIAKLSTAKLFELLALSELMQRLKKSDPGIAFELIQNGAPGSKLVFQSGPGRADPTRSWIRVSRGQTEIATLWTNVEFIGRSGEAVAEPVSGCYHEADVLLLRRGAVKGKDPFRPRYTDVLLIIECKFLNELPKVVLRNLLGLRREMSLLKPATPSVFAGAGFPAGPPGLMQLMRAHPGSHLVFAYPDQYDFKPNETWAPPADEYGLEFWPYPASAS
jgi:hypothetical protein